LSYSDGSLKSVTSQPDGTYSFTVPRNWSGTLTPAKTGYTFNPSSLPVTVTDSNLPGQDFSANQVPVLAANQGLTVVQCSTAALTADILSIADDNPAGQLLYSLAALPQVGTLQKNGLALDLSGTFTQADIDAGSLSYTHDCSATLTDSFTFAAADGLGGAIENTVFAITVTPLNPAPLIDTNVAMLLHSGGSGIVSNTFLHVADPGIAASRRIFTLTTLPAYGALNKDGTALGVGDNFSQADIDAGRIAYVQNSSEFSADQFIFTYADGLGGAIGPTTFRIKNDGYKVRLYLPFIGR
jgi:hypothetical protein